MKCEVCGDDLFIDFDIIVSVGNIMNLPYKRYHRKCYDTKKIREFLKEWIEVYNPFWTAEQILKQLEGEE